MNLVNPTLTQAQIFEAWRSGTIAFNQKLFWEAHEFWETGWKHLPFPEKAYLQALIQTCAAFHLLLTKPRFRAAVSLSKSALEKLIQTQDTPQIVQNYPQLQVPGLQGALESILTTSKKLKSPSSSELLLSFEPIITSVKAVFLESPPSSLQKLTPS